MITGNKGEWSEFYSFVKLLADGKIYAADKDLNRNESLFYIILKILRGSDLNYIRSDKIVIQRNDGSVISELAIPELIEYSNFLYKAISEGRVGTGSFEIDKIEEIFEQLKTSSLSDERRQTSDIRIVIHDPITQFQPLLGFSIKSYIGGKPTLFNASKSSNFIYKISPDLSREETINVNSLSTYTLRIKYLMDNGYKLSFTKLYSNIFKTNLELIDSRFPEIWSELILETFLNGTNKMLHLVSYLETSNPLKFSLDLNPNFYKYKIKRLLVDSALGMTAGSLWSGEFNANGGYIAVKKEGELLCFHIYNWNDFQDYLLNHTKIDLPDSKPKRCDYGRVLNYDEVGELSGSFIKLNFQIRFT